MCLADKRSAQAPPAPPSPLPSQPLPPYGRTAAPPSWRSVAPWATGCVPLWSLDADPVAPLLNLREDRPAMRSDDISILSSPDRACVLLVMRTVAPPCSVAAARGAAAPRLCRPPASSRGLSAFADALHVRKLVLARPLSTPRPPPSCCAGGAAGNGDAVGTEGWDEAGAGAMGVLASEGVRSPDGSVRPWSVGWRMRRAGVVGWERWCSALAPPLPPPFSPAPSRRGFTTLL